MSARPAGPVITEAQVDAALTAVVMHGKAAGQLPGDALVWDFVRNNPQAREGMRLALRAAAHVAAAGRGRADG